MTKHRLWPIFVLIPLTFLVLVAYNFPTINLRKTSDKLNVRLQNFSSYIEKDDHALRMQAKHFFVLSPSMQELSDITLFIEDNKGTPLWEGRAPQGMIASKDEVTIDLMGTSTLKSVDGTTISTENLSYDGKTRSFVTNRPSTLNMDGGATYLVSKERTQIDTKALVSQFYGVTMHALKDGAQFDMQAEKATFHHKGATMALQNAVTIAIKKGEITLRITGNKALLDLDKDKQSVKRIEIYGNPVKMVNNDYVLLFDHVVIDDVFLQNL